MKIKVRPDHLPVNAEVAVSADSETGHMLQYTSCFEGSQNYVYYFDLVHRETAEDELVDETVTVTGRTESATGIAVDFEQTVSESSCERDTTPGEYFAGDQKFLTDR